MKITIITVCYNAEELIEKTVNSVVMQSYKDIEFIVIDGASTDSTLNILEKYRQNIDTLVSEKDTGIYNAMNKAVKLATGDFLIFLNAGDTFYSIDSLKSAAYYLNMSHADLYFGNINVVEANGSNWIKSFENFDKMTLTSFPLCHQAIFYKRNMFEKISGYDENYKICADHDFNLKALIKYNCKAKYIPVIVSNFQSGGFSTNRSNIKNTVQEINTIALNYYGKKKLKYFNFILSLLKNIEDRKLKIFVRKLIVNLFNLNFNK